MSDFAVKVVEITNPVQHHPDADRLSLIQIGGYTCISAKLEDGSHRYSEGDLVVYVPEAAIVPEYLLKPGFWNDEKGKGILAGSNGDRVKAMRLRGIFSQGILFAPEIDGEGPMLRNEADELLLVKAGDDVAEFLGITKYEPPVPTSLQGEVCNIAGKTASYDFESIQSVPELFAVGEEVVATEKLHGTNTQIGYVPGLNHEELFFDGCLYVGSKGMSAKGLVMKDNEANDGNLYVKNLRALIAAGFGERIKEMALEADKPVRVFGEVYGAGVQKGYAYGHKAPAFAVFDIQVGYEYLPYEQMVAAAARLGVTTVPLLYEGPYDLAALEVHRDGKNTLDSTHIREGIVIKARDGSRHPYHGRKIGKWVSPTYLLKSDGEEFN